MAHPTDLTPFGLTKNENALYNLLLDGVPRTGAEIAQALGSSRQLTYRSIDALRSKGLIENTRQRGVASFTITHPAALHTLLRKQEEELAQKEEYLQTIIGPLSSAYNLHHGKPGVEFFEGEEGVQKVLDDTLNYPDEEAYVIADIEAVVRHINDINTLYIKKRQHVGLKKKALILDTPFAREYMKTYYTAITQTRLIRNEDAPPFHSIMEIYADKISYITFEHIRDDAPAIMIGAIIQDPAIHRMHRYLFEVLWRNATPLPR